MDRVFLLSPDARSRFLRSAARALGCAYICLWSPLCNPSSDLIPVCYFASKDGYWHREDDGGGCRPSSSARSTSRRLFDCYRSSLCIIQCSYVPGWAYKSSLPYIELKDSDLLNSASLQVQRQFYHEARIKTAVFLGCASGEIEFGITASNINGSVHTNAHQVFSEEFIQQWLLQSGDQELVHAPVPLDLSRPSSSISSLRSLSASSSEYSSAGMRIASPPEAAALPHQVTMQAYGRGGGAHRSAACCPFPSPASDDAAMARAILAVISSKNFSPISQTAPPPAEQSVYRSHSAADAGRQPVGAFVPYTRAYAARADAAAAVPVLHRQKMIKMAINRLRVMDLVRLSEATAAAASQEVRPTSNQLHHVISERKRREKLNDSFDALRALLPPGSKKDKASVLASTRTYVSTLKAQILELEERNRALLLGAAAATQQADRPGEIGSDDRPIQVRVESTSDQTQGQSLTLTLTVGSAEGDMIDLILGVLECLKRMGEDAVDLVSVEAGTRSPPSNLRIEARFRLRVVKGDWDEESFGEGVRKAIEASVAKSGPSD